MLASTISFIDAWYSIFNTESNWILLDADVTQSDSRVTFDTHLNVRKGEHLNNEKPITFRKSWTGKDTDVLNSAYYNASYLLPVTLRVA